MVDVCDGKVYISVGDLYNRDCEMGMVAISVGKVLGGFTSCTPLGLLRDNVVGNIISYT